MSRIQIIVSKGRGIKIRLERRAWYLKVFKKALKLEKSIDTSLELHFVRSSEMKILNRTHRKKNKPTDVLSFEVHRHGLCGLIVIDLDTAAKQAKEYQHSLQQELRELYVHGVAHLLGYDHMKTRDARAMKRFEEKLLSV